MRWFTDNQNVARIISVGSRVPELQILATNIFRMALRYQISIEPEWIPRDLNGLADYISKIVDYDDWMLNPEVVISLDNLWGPHSVDRFASSVNAQFIRFNSRFWCAGTETVDTFTVDWGPDNNWWCPPVGLIPRLLQHARACGCSGTLIVPIWRSAPFWLMLCPEGSHFAEFVQEVVMLPYREDLFLPGMSGALLFKKEINTDVLANRLLFGKLLA